jgi:copper(I)-binding protein
MTIQNAGSADALIGVKAALAPHSALHSMVMDGGVMRMRQIERIDLPAGATVELQQQTGVHIMLEGLTQPLKPGESFPMKLSFEKAGEITVDIHVEALHAHAHTE